MDSAVHEVADDAIRLCFPAKAEYLVLARLAVGGLARSLPFGPATVADLKLAVTEACGNAVRHAYTPAEHGMVVLDLVVARDQLDVVVADRGAGIELPVAQRVSLPTEDGGRGLSIMRIVTDELEISNAAHGRGTVVRMTKRFPAMRDGRGARDVVEV